MKLPHLVKNLILIIFLFVFLLLITTPIIIFFLKFNNLQMSTDMNDWGAFGSYVGGVTGSIISFFSLAILGYITYMVGKNSTNENKNLFIFKKRIEAYDELIKFGPRLNSISIANAKINFNHRFNKIIGQEETLEIFHKKIIDQLSVFDFYPDFHYFLYNFNARYNHIFNYDFKSKPFIDLLKYSENFNKSILSSYNDFDPYKKLTENDKDNFDIESFNKMNSHLIDFINKLKKELK